MRQRVMAGAELDVLTPAEAATLLEAHYARAVTNRVRAEESKATDATGAVTVPVFTIPLGFEFELRRFFVTGDGISDVAAQQFAYAAGTAIWLARSGEILGYLGQTGGSARRLPSEGSYGDEQGPYLRNGETLELWTVAGPASTVLQVTAEGILRRPPARDEYDRRGAGRRAPAR